MYALFTVDAEWSALAASYGLAPRVLMLAMEYLASVVVRTHLRDGGLNVRECGLEQALEDEEGFSKTLATVFNQTVGPRNVRDADAHFSGWASTMTVGEIFALHPNVSSRSP